jgi:plastocyanin
MPSPAPTAGSPIQPLLDLAAVFITPDWNALLKLFPLFLAILFVAWFAFTLRGFVTLGPRRRAPARIQPVTPADIHMPGGSTAPIVVAVGAFALFAGVIIESIGVLPPGFAIVGGTVVLIATLLLWGREAMRDYSHIEAPQRRMLPAVVHEGPPPGVHMPGPSIRPLLGALGSAALFMGLVFGGWVLALAVVFLVWTLLGWLVDFTAEYRKVEEADHTGHLENIPDRRLPIRALQIFGVAFVVLAMFQAGILPPAGPATAGGPGASPGTSGGPAPSGGGGGGGAEPPPGAKVVIAKNIEYDVKTLEVEAGKPFTIFFENQDAPGVTHDVDLRSADGSELLQDQPTIDGGTSQAYEYTALQPGTYEYRCSIHPVPIMTGTITVK